MTRVSVRVCLLLLLLRVFSSKRERFEEAEQRDWRALFAASGGCVGF